MSATTRLPPQSRVPHQSISPRHCERSEAIQPRRSKKAVGRACFQCGPTDLRLMLSEYDCPRPASPLRVYRMKAGRLAAASTGSRLDHAESSGRCDGCLAKTTLFEQTTILVFGALAAARATEHVQVAHRMCPVHVADVRRFRPTV